MSRTVTGMRHVSIVTVMGALKSPAVGRKRRAPPPQLVMELMDNGDSHAMASISHCLLIHGHSVFELHAIWAARRAVGTCVPYLVQHRAVFAHCISTCAALGVSSMLI